MRYTRSCLLSVATRTAALLLSFTLTNTLASPLGLASAVSISAPMTATAVITVAPSTSSSSGFAAHKNIVSTFSPFTGTSYRPLSSSSDASTPSTSATSTTAAIPAAPTTALPLSVPFPQPFDQSLSYSLTDSCVAFLATYLESDEMRGTSGTGVGKCGRPFGLLMSSSSGWATITRNETLLTAALSQICYTPLSTTTTTTNNDCSDYYRSLAVNVQRSGNCGVDLKRKNPVALEALYGFQNYDMLQLAACLTDTETHAYCYAQAMSTTSSTPDDGYLYQLPVGIPLPSTSRPTCSSCSAKLVNLFTETVLDANTDTIATTASSSTTVGQGYSYAPVLEGVLTNTTMGLKQACGSTFAGQITTMQAHVSSGARSRFIGTHRQGRARSCWDALLGNAFVLPICVGVLGTVLLDFA